MELTWNISIDTGGTFTDCLAIDSEGNERRVKVMSNSSLRGIVAEWRNQRFIKINENWDLPDQFIEGFSFSLLKKYKYKLKVIKYDAKQKIIELEKPFPYKINSGDAFEVQSNEEAPILAARCATKTNLNQLLPKQWMRLATTRGTNALLEEKGAKVVFFVSKGFKDLLIIGDQTRSDLFAKKIEPRLRLYDQVIEIDERLDASGNVLKKLETNLLDQQVTKLLEEGYQVACIALLHSFKNPIHEVELSEYLSKKGFGYVSVSSSIAAKIKLLPRAITSLVNAYLMPIMHQYLNRVYKSLNEGELLVMNSSGGLVPKDAFLPKDSLLSGPAGGIVGAVSVAKAAGYGKVLSFDMGGTSTDVSRFKEDYEYQQSHQVGKATLFAPSLKIKTVAAGGGSICGYKDGALYVGPDSAGAEPGPACYGVGGPLTVTDVNLLLGRVDERNFNIPIVREDAEKRINEIIAVIKLETGDVVSRDDLLIGYHDIATELMSDAIQKISICEGYAPFDYTLVTFGGAGGQFCCKVAEKLAIESIIIPHDAGILSAVGLKESRIERIEEQQILKTLDSELEYLEAKFQELENKGLEYLIHLGLQPEQIRSHRRIIDLRIIGQDSELSIEFEGIENIGKQFKEKYFQVFGEFPDDKQIEVTTIRVIVAKKQQDILEERFEKLVETQSKEKGRAFIIDKWCDIPFYGREELQIGDCMVGPAVIQDPFSTSVIDPGWEAIVGSQKNILLKKIKKTNEKIKSYAEVIQRELFTHRFYQVVDEMGLQLQKTALSINIKERLDFSCALLDSRGYLIVNAPHIPVHLGALGYCVRAVAKTIKMKPGDVIVTNHPGMGGSHLPDITVITPVFIEGELTAYLANRAHHAEIGGTRPGSVVPFAKSLAEEGVVISPMHLFKEGAEQYFRVKEVLLGSPYPTRAIHDNLSDLKAQVAANRRGAKAIEKLIRDFGRKQVCFYMQSLLQHSKGALAKRLLSLKEFKTSVIEVFDDDTQIAVGITVSNGRVGFDFQGTSAQHHGNLNATPAILNSVIIYVLRFMIEEDIPLNEGLLELVDIDCPTCFLNPNFSEDNDKAPAVMAGNVETSQRLTNALLKGFGIIAKGQGTMNNLIIGNQCFSYYETICGGAGAGDGFNGANAVHTHMTNTAITDPEILEMRYPVRLEQFSLRRKSGGEGKFKGGDGVIRQLRFLENISLSILSQHRKNGPEGICGGGRGKKGMQKVIFSDGREIELDSMAECELGLNDQLIIETPGGGAYGKLSL